MKSARAARLQIAVLAALTVVLGACGGARARYASHLERGKQYLEQGNLDKAGVEFRNALQIQPKDADALYLNGRVAEERGNLREAVGLYQGALDMRPGFEQARARLGRALVFAGAATRALEVAQPGLVTAPDDPDLLAVRAAANHQLKDDTAALADAEHAVRVAPSNENAVGILAALYVQAGDSARALSLVNAAVQRLPGSVDLHAMLANLYSSSAQPEKAEAQMRKLIELRPRDLALRRQLAQHFVRAHQLDAAQQVLEEAVKAVAGDNDRARQDAAKLTLVDFIATQRSRADGEKTLRGYIAQEPDNTDLRSGLGALLQRTGALPEAIAAYEAVIEHAGTGAPGLLARDRIAAIELAQGRLDKATQLVDEVLRKNPRDDDALTMRANLSLQRKDPTSAIADLRAVLRDQPKSIPVQRTLARAYLLKGQPALAEEALRTVLADSANDPAVRVDLARLLGQTERAAQALTLLQETVQHFPDDVEARVAQIQINIARGDLPAALAAAEDLKTRQPSLGVGFYLCGLIAAQQKRFDAAQQNLERAAALQPDAVEVLSLLAQVEMAQGQPDSAIARVQAAVQHHPGRAEWLGLLADLYLRQKDLVRAGEEFEAALRVAPGDPRWVLGLAGVYEKQGRIDDAIARYEALYKREPGSQLAANNLAMLLVTYKTDAASLDRARELTSAFATSSNGMLLDTNGWVRFKRHEYGDAVAVLERAAERAPDSQVIRDHLGEARSALASLKARAAERPVSSAKSAAETS